MITTCTYKATRLILRNNNLLVLLLIFAAACNTSGEKYTSEPVNKPKRFIDSSNHKTFSNNGAIVDNGAGCSDEFSIELFNNTSKDSIIGEPDDSYEGYVRSKPWSNDGPYPPKFFDLKISQKMAYDSVLIEMNVVSEKNSQCLLKKNIIILNKLYYNKNYILVKDIKFEDIYNSFPSLN